MKKLSLCGVIVLSVVILGSGLMRPSLRASSVLASPARQSLQAPAQNVLPVSAQDFGRLPLSFIANRGQADPRVAFTVQGRDKTLFFTPEGITIRLISRETGETSPSIPDRSAPGPSEKREKAKNWTVKLDFLGADPDVRPVGLDGNGVEELVLDAASLGLWIWNGSWAQMSGVNPDALVWANVDADPADELVVDFGAAGIWLYNGGSWSQIRS